MDNKPWGTETKTGSSNHIDSVCVFFFEFSLVFLVFCWWFIFMFEFILWFLTIPRFGNNVFQNASEMCINIQHSHIYFQYFTLVLCQESDCRTIASSHFNSCVNVCVALCFFLFFSLLLLFLCSRSLQAALAHCVSFCL